AAVHMGTDRSIANGIAPVDEPFLILRLHSGQSRRSLRQFNEICGLNLCGRNDRIRQTIIFHVRANAPIGPLMWITLILVCRNNLAFAQAANLVIDDFQNSVSMTYPIALRLSVWWQVLAGIAHQHGLIILPDGLDPHIIVNAAIAKDDLGIERLLEQYSLTFRVEVARS